MKRESCCEKICSYLPSFSSKKEKVIQHLKNENKALKELNHEMVKLMKKLNEENAQLNGNLGDDISVTHARIMQGSRYAND